MRALPVIGLFVLSLSSVPAVAQCPAYAYTLTNGTTADANQVMANFNSILNCAAPLTAPMFTSNITVSGAAPYQTFVATGAGTDQKKWDTSESSNGASLVLRAVNDAYTAATAWMQVNRGSGYTITNVVFPSSITAAGYVTASDRRLKKDIDPINYGIDTVMKLKPVTFNWIQQETDLQKKHQVGLIAQELEAVVPEAVSVEKDEMQTRGIAYASLVPVLIKAIQDLKKENDELGARLKTVEQHTPLVSVKAGP